MLIVDDDAAICSSLEAIFRREGYDVRSHKDSTGALATVQSWPPDILIADMILRSLNGVELAMEVTQQFPRCKVVPFAPRPAELLIDQALSLGFAVFHKPVAPPVLIDQVKALLQSTG